MKAFSSCGFVFKNENTNGWHTKKRKKCKERKQEMCQNTQKCDEHKQVGISIVNTVFFLTIVFLITVLTRINIGRRQ